MTNDQVIEKAKEYAAMTEAELNKLASFPFNTVVANQRYFSFIEGAKFVNDNKETGFIPYVCIADVKEWDDKISCRKGEIRYFKATDVPSPYSNFEKL